MQIVHKKSRWFVFGWLSQMIATVVCMVISGLLLTGAANADPLMVVDHDDGAMPTENNQHWESIALSAPEIGNLDLQNISVDILNANFVEQAGSLDDDVPEVIQDPYSVPTVDGPFDHIDGAMPDLASPSANCMANKQATQLLNPKADIRLSEAAYRQLVASQAMTKKSVLVDEAFPVFSAAGIMNSQKNRCGTPELVPVMPMNSPRRAMHIQYNLHRWFTVVEDDNYVCALPDDAVCDRFDGQQVDRCLDNNPDLEVPASLPSPVTAPNDPRFPYAWTLHYQNNGLVTVDGVNEDVDLDVMEAWQYTKGNPDVIVAISDDAFDYQNEDFMASVWLNQAEDIDQDGRHTATDDNGCDEDGNGYVDDVHGWNATRNNNQLDLQTNSDGIRQSSHGASIAPPAFAGVNDGLGIAGVAGKWHDEPNTGARLMLVASGFNVRALGYALENNATIYSISYVFGGGVDTDFSRAFVEQAQSPSGQIKGGIIFAGAGNYGIGLTAPSAAESQDFIPVGGYRPDGEINNFGYGTIAGPASGVPGFSYYYNTATQQYTESHFTSGTSAATPIVAAIAALIRSHCPSLSPDAVKALLINSASNTDFGKGYAGIVNAMKSVEACHVESSNLPTAILTPNVLHFVPEHLDQGFVNANVTVTNPSSESQTVHLGSDNSLFVLPAPAITLAPYQQRVVEVSYAFDEGTLVNEPSATISLYNQAGEVLDETQAYSHMPWLREVEGGLPDATPSQVTPVVNCIWWDYDQDLDLDVACQEGSSYQPKLSLFTNENGNYVTPQLLPTHILQASLIVTDVDRDGRSDLLLAGKRDVIYEDFTVRWVSGDDLSVHEIDVPDTLHVQNEMRAQMADLDNDRQVDLVVAKNIGFHSSGKYEYEIIRFYQDDGVFVEAADKHTALGVNLDSLATLDSSRDGTKDIIFASERSNGQYELTQLEVSGYQAPRTYTEKRLLRSNTRHFDGVSYVTDFNLDGHDDVIANANVGSYSSYFHTRSELSKLFVSTNRDGQHQLVSVKNSVNNEDQVMRDYFFRYGSPWFAEHVMDLDRDGQREMLGFSYASGGNERYEKYGFRVYNYIDPDQPYFLGEQLISGKVVSEVPVLGMADPLRNGQREFAMRLQKTNADPEYLSVFKTTLKTNKPNLPPNPPARMKVTELQNGHLRFGFVPTGDDYSSFPTLTYHVAIRNKATGEWVLSPEGDLATGIRYQHSKGNAQYRCYVDIDPATLADGEYEWFAQVVDSDLRGSQWTQATYYHNVPPPPPNLRVENDANDLTVPNDNTRGRPSTQRMQKYFQATVHIENEYRFNPAKAFIYAYRQDMRFEEGSGCRPYSFGHYTVPGFYLCDRPETAANEPWIIAADVQFMDVHPWLDYVYIRAYGKFKESDYRDNIFRHYQRVN